MTLSFSTKWPDRMGELAGQPNYFIEKIYSSLPWNLIGHHYFKLRDEHFRKFKKKFDGSYPVSTNIRSYHLPKLHTIRNGNRWKAGMKIHPVINNRTKDRFQFAPTMVCTSVQDIEIIDVSHLHGHTYPLGYIMTIWVNGINFHKLFDVIIDGKKLNRCAIEKLAINDGFPSVEAFFAFFNNDFKGQIIHWTDFKY